MRDSQATRPRSIDDCKNYSRLINSAMEEDKVDKGNVDKYRRSMSGLTVTNAETWGRDQARQRYGQPQSPDMKPKDMSMPQFKQTDGRGPDWADDHKNDWVRGFGKNGQESAETMPNFDRSKGGRR